MSMLPFEKKVELNIAGTKYETSVTNYKGTVDLEFVMDDPFWYSIINIFGQVTIKDGHEVYANQWDGSEDFFNEPDKLKDVLKIVYEDGIPLYHMIASPMLFGNNVYAASGGRLNSKVATVITQNEYDSHSTEEGYFYNSKVVDGETVITYYKGASINYGTIDGAYVTTTANNSLTIPIKGSVNLYYSGTAPAPIKLSFKVRITTDNNGYVNSIANMKALQNDIPYNTITFKSLPKNA